METNPEIHDSPLTSPKLHPGSGADKRLPAFGILGAVVLAVLIFAFIGPSKKIQTLELVKEWTKKLDLMTEKSGTYIHWESEPTLPIEDAWGTKLQVQYSKPDELTETLLVSSAGPDKAFGTKDDITETAFTGVLANVKHLAKEGIKQTGKSLAEGFIEAGKEEFKNQKEKEKK